MRTDLMISAARAGLLAVRAEGASSDDAVLAAITALRASTDERFATITSTVTALEDEANRHALASAARMLNGPANGIPVDAEYTAQFDAFFRTGGSRAEAAVGEAHATGVRAAIIKAALDEGSNGGEGGGYLAPSEWDRRISTALRSFSPMRRICDVRVTTTSAYTSLWQMGAPGSGWVGETAARPATATPTFKQIPYEHGEIFANAYATQRLLNDSEVDLAQWLVDEYDAEFSKQEGVAFISGDGINKPLGLLLYGTGGMHATKHPAGAITVVASGNANTLTVDGLIDFAYRLAAPYRQNATWLMNSLTAATLSKLKDGQGNLIWRESLAAGQPSTLLGRPVEIDENMPDIAAGTTPIIFGDFLAGYVINDRQGTRVLRDPYTNKPYVGFYATRRVGGGVKDPNAFRILKIAA